MVRKKEEKMKYIKYYFIFLIENRKLYAYTDNKEIFENFKKTRDMNLFYVKKIMMTSKDIRVLFEEDYNYNILMNYKFKQNGVEIVFPITKLECQNIENYSNRIAYVDIYTHTEISPNIFKKDMQILLRNLGYYEAKEYYEDGKKTSNILPDYLTSFLTFYIFSINQLRL